MNNTEFEKALRTRRPFKWLTQTVLFETFLFGKGYFWMQDVDGTIYLAKVGPDGLPDIS